MIFSPKIMLNPTFDLYGSHREYYCKDMAPRLVNGGSIFLWFYLDLIHLFQYGSVGCGYVVGGCDVGMMDDRIRTLDRLVVHHHRHRCCHLLLLTSHTADYFVLIPTKL